jgi:hypothetical protein
MQTMGFFQEIDEQYFVEEISYDDMMLILEHQKHEHESESLSDKPLQNQPDKYQEQHLAVDTAATVQASEHKTSKADEIARRIAENANKKLPNWLLNH